MLSFMGNRLSREAVFLMPQAKGAGPARFSRALPTWLGARAGRVPPNRTGQGTKGIPILTDHVPWPVGQG